MSKKCFTAIGIAALSIAAFAPSAAAGDGASSQDGGACVKAGLSTLKSLGLLSAAAQGAVDYDAVDSDMNMGEGPINADLPAGSFLPLSTVIKLHQTSPELFDWCS